MSISAHILQQLPFSIFFSGTKTFLLKFVRRSIIDTKYRKKNLQVLSNKIKRVNKYILFCLILQFSSPNSLSFLSDVERISVLIVPNFSARWQSIQTILTETSGLARNKFFLLMILQKCLIMIKKCTQFKELMSRSQIDLIYFEFYDQEEQFKVRLIDQQI